MSAYHLIYIYIHSHIFAQTHTKCPLADKQRSAIPPSKNSNISEAMKKFLTILKPQCSQMLGSFHATR